MCLLKELKSHIRLWVLKEPNQRQCVNIWLWRGKLGATLKLDAALLHSPPRHLLHLRRRVRERVFEVFFAYLQLLPAKIWISFASRKSHIEAVRTFRDSEFPGSCLAVSGNERPLTLSDFLVGSANWSEEWRLLLWRWQQLKWDALQFIGCGHALRRISPLFGMEHKRVRVPSLTMLSVAFHMLDWESSTSSCSPPPHLI